MHQRSKFGASDSTYHSFNDIELFEPPSPPRNTSSSHGRPQSRPQKSMTDERPLSAVKMQRQDSGYESFSPSPRTSTSQSRRPSVSRRISNGSSSSTGPAPASRLRSRPSTRRSAKSYPQHQTSQPLYLVRSNTNSIQHPHVTYFQFPSPEPGHMSEPSPSDPPHDAPPAFVPPQTTHYWTSDDTRRLEYAAIDAASRGVKGWIRRKLMPDCFVPKENRHVSFDDDTGSVRRYRLELEDEPDACEKTACRRRKGWTSWFGSKNSV